MSRRLQSLVILALFMIAIPSIAPSQEKAKPRQNVLDHERFCVTIWPETTRVGVGETFDLKIRVVNSSNKTQSLSVMTCSFWPYWESNNSLIGSARFKCFGNVLATIDLKPGEAYERKEPMMISNRAKSKAEPFKIGLTSHGEQKTYWSNEVVLGIE